MSFRDAVADLAQQVGMAVPEGPIDAAEQQRALQARAHQATLSEVLERAAEHYRRQLKDAPAGHRLSQAPRPERRDRPALRPGLCAGRLAQPGQRLPALRRPAAGRKRHGHRAGRRRPGAEALRPLSRAHHVPDPLGQGRGHRLRRPRARQRRAQVPELAGDAGVRQGARAVRPVRGPHRAACQGLRARGRRLHGRGGAGAARLCQRRGHARHRLHGGACAKAVPIHRHGGVRLRRRCRRPARRRPCTRSRAAAGHRPAQRALPVPAQRARSRQLRARTGAPRLSRRRWPRRCRCRAN